MSLKQVGSAITTLAKGRGSATSLSPTESGVLTPLSSTKKATAVARMLEVNNPHQLDKNLISSLESLTGYPVIEDSIVRYKAHGATGWRYFCSEKCWADFNAMPIQEEGYYGLERLE